MAGKHLAHTAATRPRKAPRHLRRSYDKAELAATNEFASSAPREAASTAALDATNPSAPKTLHASVSASAALMSGLVILSRITGFFRTWGQAYALGVTVVSSAYTVANNLPNQLYELVMGGMLITAFLPVYMSVKEKRGRKGANEYASNLCSLILLLMGLVALIGFVFAGHVIWTQSFSARQDFNAPLTTLFFRFFVIEIVLYGLSSLLSGMLNAEREYLWSNAAPIFNNFICTASFVLYALLQQSEPFIALLILAIGNPLGVAVQVLVQVPALHKIGVRLRLRINLHDPALKETLAIGVPSLLLTAGNFVTTSVQTSSSLSVTAAGASIAYYARLWFTLPYSIFAIPITVAMFTELSDTVAHNDMKKYKHGVCAGTSQILFFLVPCMMYLVVFARPLSLALGASHFGAADSLYLTQYIIFLGLSLPFYGVCTYLQKVCSSLRAMGVLIWASVAASIIQVLQCLFLTEQFGLANVAISSLIFFIIVDAVVFWYLRQRLSGIGLTSIVVGFGRAVLIGCVGSMVGAALLWILQALGFGNTTLTALATLAVAGIPTLIVSFGFAYLRNFPEAHFLRTMLGRFIKPRRMR